MLQVSNLTKKYDKTNACDNVSFTLEPGSITVLLGPNGAGKSTVIKSITGFLRYSGKITVAGLDNKSVEAKKYIGYIPEIPVLYPNLTVAEHLEFIARAYRITEGGRGNSDSNYNYKEYAESLLKRFQIYDIRKKFGDELSKGMQQKLSICCGLLPRPSLLLFDEPMIGLDPHAIKELKSIFTEQRNAGATLLVSTHMIDSVDMLWDRTLIMKEGKIAADIRRDELHSTDRHLEDIFFEITENASGDTAK